MQRFEHILFVATPDTNDAGAFERTLRLAEANQARVTVVDLRPAAATPPPNAPAGITGELLREAVASASAATLADYAQAADGRVEVAVHTLYGIGFVEVVRAVLRDGHDLVVKAAEGAAGRRGSLFGSLDMHLLRKCPVPLLLARPTPDSPRYRRVLAAVDFDPQKPVEDGDSLNRRIVQAAADQALAEFAELHVAHAWEAPFEGILRSRGVFSVESDAQRYVDAERDAREAALGRLIDASRDWIGDDAYDYLRPTPHLRQGTAGEAIPAIASELAAELVVMGTVGRTGIAGLLIGNTAETILDGIAASVLAIKPPGFRTPIEPAG